LKQKKRSKRKIQGCDKKAKKQLHSAKVVKLAQLSLLNTKKLNQPYNKVQNCRRFYAQTLTPF